VLAKMAANICPSFLGDVGRATVGLLAERKRHMCGPEVLLKEWLAPV